MSIVGWMILVIVAYAGAAPVIALAIGRRLGGERIRYGHEFTCRKCGWHVYAPVHVGPRRVCAICQSGMPPLERNKP